MHAAWIYILTNKHNKVLYIGVTNDLRTRLWQHRTKQNPKSFTARYNVYKLVYFEGFELITDAIAREKYLNNRGRVWKLELIQNVNPEMKQLSAEV